MDSKYSRRRSYMDLTHGSPLTGYKGGFGEREPVTTAKRLSINVPFYVSARNRKGDRTQSPHAWDIGDNIRV
jgi:hypothetical protein